MIRFIQLLVSHTKILDMMLFITYVTAMVRNGLLIPDVFHRWNSDENAYVPCTVLEWQNEMIQEGHYTDEIFVRTAAELLQRQIILYPVIPNINDNDRLIVSPSIESTHEPFHIIYYEEANFVIPIIKVCVQEKHHLYLLILTMFLEIMVTIIIVQTSCYEHIKNT